MPQLDVQIWSDIACPWCYVGKRRFEAALRQFEHREQVRVTWRSFELDPAAPRVRDDGRSYAERLAGKYGVDVAEAQQRIDAMVETAKGEGLAFRFDLIRPGNTFDAHRLVHLATARGCGDAAKERLLQAYLERGLAIGDHAVLRQIGEELDLDRREVVALLEGNDQGDQVRADEEMAMRNGIRSVPFFVFAERLALAGAHPPATILDALNQAWGELTAPEAGGDAGPSCGSDGCC